MTQIDPDIPAESLPARMKAHNEARRANTATSGEDAETDAALRLRALELAVADNAGGTGEDTLKVAARFLAFLTGETEQASV